MIFCKLCPDNKVSICTVDDDSYCHGCDEHVCPDCDKHPELRNPDLWPDHQSVQDHITPASDKIILEPPPKTEFTIEDLEEWCEQLGLTIIINYRKQHRPRWAVRLMKPGSQRANGENYAWCGYQDTLVEAFEEAVERWGCDDDRDDDPHEREEV